MSAYSSRSRLVRARFRRAVDGGLVAAANVAINAIKMGYNPPQYFVGPANRKEPLTGNLLASWQHTPPENVGTMRVIRVGTDVMYALYWELGWMPRFGTRVYDPETDRSFLVQAAGPRRLLRKEIIRPAFHGSAPQQRAAFERVFRRMMGGGGGETIVTMSEAAD